MHFSGLFYFCMIQRIIKLNFVYLFPLKKVFAHCWAIFLRLQIQMLPFYVFKKFKTSSKKKIMKAFIYQFSSLIYFLIDQQHFNHLSQIKLKENMKGIIIMFVFYEKFVFFFIQMKKYNLILILIQKELKKKMKIVGFRNIESERDFDFKLLIISTIQGQQQKQEVSTYQNNKNSFNQNNKNTSVQNSKNNYSHINKNHTRMNRRTKNTSKNKSSSEYCPDQIQDSVDKKYQDAQIKQTKNIPKLYVKGICLFIKKIQIIVENILLKQGIEKDQFFQKVDQIQCKIISIQGIRQLWMQKHNKYARIFRILSNLFLRKHFLHHIFYSKIYLYRRALKYRYKFLEGVQNPQQFTLIKQF